VETFVGLAATLSLRQAATPAAPLEYVYLEGNVVTPFFDTFFRDSTQATTPPSIVRVEP
jgi:hypothetical protein